MDDIGRLDMLALGCAIGAVILLATCLALVIANRATRLTFKDESPSREEDGK